MPIHYELVSSIVENPSQKLITLYNNFFATILIQYPQLTGYLQSCRDVMDESIEITHFVESHDPASLRPKNDRIGFASPFDVPEPNKETILTIVLDLDETLIHSIVTEEDTTYPTIDTYVRPFAIDLINLLSAIPELEVIVWSAGVQAHVQACLDVLDPKAQIKYYVYRDSSYRNAHWDKEKKPEYTGKKILSWLPGRAGRAILFDDALPLGTYPFKNEHSEFTDRENPVITINPFMNDVSTDETYTNTTLMAVLSFALYALDQMKKKPQHTYNLLSQAIYSFADDSITSLAYLNRLIIPRHKYPVELGITTFDGYTLTYVIRALHAAIEKLISSIEPVQYISSVIPEAADESKLDLDPCSEIEQTTSSFISAATTTVLTGETDERTSEYLRCTDSPSDSPSIEQEVPAVPEDSDSTLAEIIACAEAEIAAKLEEQRKELTSMPLLLFSTGSRPPLRIINEKQRPGNERRPGEVNIRDLLAQCTTTSYYSYPRR